MSKTVISRTLLDPIKTGNIILFLGSVTDV